jgi:hypothetical protein
MTEWAVFGVLVAVAGFLAVVVPPIVNLTKSITRLTVVVDKLSTDLEEQKQRNIESHSKLWAHNEELDGRINDHETRIRLLEEIE